MLVVLRGYSDMPAASLTVLRQPGRVRCDGVLDHVRVLSVLCLYCCRCLLVLLSALTVEVSGLSLHVTWPLRCVPHRTGRLGPDLVS